MTMTLSMCIRSYNHEKIKTHFAVRELLREPLERNVARGAHRRDLVCRFASLPRRARRVPHRGSRWIETTLAASKRLRDDEVSHAVGEDCSVADNTVVTGGWESGVEGAVQKRADRCDQPLVVERTRHCFFVNEPVRAAIHGVVDHRVRVSSPVGINVSGRRTAGVGLATAVHKHAVPRWRSRRKDDARQQ